MSKFMPPKPTNADTFHTWFDREIKSLFENAVEVYSQDGSDWIENVPTNWATHKALLINIQPIKEDTAEDLLREIVNTQQVGTEIDWATWRNVIDKARKYLEKKK